MAADVAVSLSLLAGVVGLSDATRRLITGLFPGTALCVCAVELVSTFQLCCCTHELKLLSEVGGLAPGAALTLTYLLSVLHALTFRGALGNPCVALEHAYHARISRGCALRRVACQFAAAAAARAACPLMWGLGLSRLHVRHKLLGYPCVSAIRAPLHAAAAVEFACAFAVQTAITCTRPAREAFRVHAVAAVIAAAVSTGGSMTGAVFNPALAFSTQFPCSGSSFLEYCLVYWLGPLLGMMSSVLLLDKIVPSLSGKSAALHLPLEAKKRT
ncbi:aquaporin-11 [Trachinotus anak]|uniref:aquaporin-11 n=1 Tax=Trachinotus anak TaxID=443729 RepID=UPI0039F22A9F